MAFGYSAAPTVGLGGGYNNPFDIPGGGSGGGTDWMDWAKLAGGLALGGLGAYQNQQGLNSQNAMTKEQLAEHKREFDIQNAYRSNPQFRQYLAFIGKRFGVPDSVFQPSSAPSAPPPAPGSPGDPHHGIPYVNPSPTIPGTNISDPSGKWTKPAWYHVRPKTDTSGSSPATAMMRSQFGF